MGAPVTGISIRYMHQEFIKSKHPLICAPMNRVSDLALAIAIHNAGCYPSLVADNYLSISQLEHDLQLFISATGAANLILALESQSLLQNRQLVDVLTKYKVSHIEIFDRADSANVALMYLFDKIRASGTKIIFKMLSVLELGKLASHIDGVVIKTPDAAARVIHDKYDAVQRIEILKSSYPHLHVIASGGIGNNSDIQKYINAGATAVSAGTLFAVSAESSISSETKKAMVQSTYADTVTVGEAKQTALVFSPTADADGNNTNGLELGVKSPAAGLVFVGKAIDSVTEIKTVEQIVRELF